MNTLNHLKKGESLNDKQLVIINSTERDLSEQNTTSFTYTFDEPIERVSKIDIISAKIPKTFYNVNNDNSTLSITTQTFDETNTVNLAVNDNEISNNIIEATNVVDGTVFKINLFDGIGDTNVIKITVNNTFIYTAGIYKSGLMHVQDFTGEIKGTPLPNSGSDDIFVVKYSLDQVFIWHVRLSGGLNDTTVDIAANDTIVCICGNINSIPLKLYNHDESLAGEITTDGLPSCVLATYNISGVLNWVIKIEGIISLSTQTKVVIINEFIYIAGTCSRNLTFYTGSNVDYTLAFSETSTVFLAKYDINGTLIWVTKIESNCSLNDIAFHESEILCGISFVKNINTFDQAYPLQPVLSLNPLLFIVGNQNTCVIKYNTDGFLVNKFKIAGSSVESNIKLDINSNYLVVSGLTSSNPLVFYDTSDNFVSSININDIYYNMFIALYDNHMNFLWASTIYSQSIVYNVDIGLSLTNEILVLGNYSNILKFNNSNLEYQIGKDLLNLSNNSYAFIAKFDTNGNLINRNHIEGNVITSSLDTTSNNIFISAQFNGTSIDIFSSNNDLLSTKNITNPSSDTNIYKGVLMSYINNINNYIINDNIINKRILQKTLIGTDLNYTLNLNALSQEMGFNTSQKFRAMVFGDVINWTSLDVDSSNDTLIIVFSIGNLITKTFNQHTISFKIPHISSTDVFPSYSPYSLAYELSKQIKLTLVKYPNINDTNMGDSVIYDSNANIFYIIFGINGTFTIEQNNLGLLGLFMPISVSRHCAITDVINENIPIKVFDNSKLSMKLLDDITEYRYNNESFETIFPTISNKSGSLYLNALSNKQVSCITGGIFESVSDDIKINDIITFDTPWTREDNNETSISIIRNWTECSISSNGQKITAVAKNSNIYTSDDGGIVWTKRGGSNNWTGLDTTYDMKTQTAIVGNGYIYVSEDYGISWNPKDTSRMWKDISISKTNGLYQSAVVLGGKIFISSNTGTSWIGVEENRNWTSVSMSNNGMYQTATVYNGYIYSSYDYGMSWSQESIINTWQSTSMSGDGSIRVAVNLTGSLYKSTNFGAWVELIVDAGQIMDKIAMSENGMYQTIIGNTSKIYVSSDSGNTWVIKSILESFSGISISQTGQYQIVVTRYGLKYVSTDYGTTWRNIFNKYVWWSSEMSSTGVIQTVSSPSGLFISRNSGYDWVKTNIPSAQLAMSSTGQYIVVSNQLKSVLISSDYGVTTTSVNVFTNNTYSNYVAISASGKYILCISDSSNRVAVSNNFGVDGSWVETLFILNTVGGGSMSKSGKYMAIKNYKSNDYGETWVVGRSSSSISQMSLDGQYQTEIIVSTLYRSNDYGMSWIAGPISQFFRHIKMSVDGKYRTAVGTTRIWISHDYGVTWSERDIARSYNALSMSADGSIQIVCADNDKIYRSSDYGLTWFQRDFQFEYIQYPITGLSSSISDNGKYIMFSGIMSNNAGLSYTSNGNVGGVLKMSANGKYRVTGGGAGIINASYDYGVTWANITIAIGVLFDTGIDISADGQTVIFTARSIDVWVAVGWDEGGVNPPLTFVSELTSNNYGSVCMNNMGSVRYVGQRHTFGGPYYIWKYSSGVWDSGTLIDSPIAYMDTDSTGNILIMVPWLPTSVSLSTNGSAGPFTTLPVPIPINTFVTGCAISPDGQKMYVSMSNQYNVQHEGSIAKSIDGGNTWTIHGISRNWNHINISHDGSRLTASANDGGLYTSSDAGESWHFQPDKITPTLISVSGDGIKQLVSNAGSYLMSSVNKGSTWNIIPYNNNWSKLKISKTNGITQIAVPYYGKLLISNNTGVDWSYKFSEKKWRSASTSADGTIIYACAYNDDIYKSTDSGNTWNPESAGIKDWIDISISNNGSVAVAAVQNGDIWTSTGGGPWLNTNSAGVQKWSSISISGNGDIQLASVYDGQLYVSSDTGTTWITIESTRNWVETDMTEDGVKQYAITLGGKIYKSTNLGLAWEAIETDRLWSSISVGLSSTNLIAAVEYAGNIYQSVDNGIVWDIQPTLTELKSVCMNSNGNIQLISKLNRELLLSLDRGVSFTLINISKDWRQVSMSSNGLYQTALAYGDYVYISTNTGASFTPINVLSTGNWNSVAMSLTGQYITVSKYDGELWVSNDYGINWASTSPTAKWSSVSMSNTGEFQTAVAQNLIIYRSIDYGVTWVSATSSSLYYKSISVSGTGLHQTALVYGGSIWQSSDYGSTWIQNTTQPNRNWIKIDMSDDGTKQVAIVNSGKIYYSINTGSTWSETENNRSWRDIVISSDGSFQIACDTNNVFIHNFSLEQNITLNVNNIYSENNVNDYIYFNESASGEVGPPLLPDLTPIHGYNLANANNFTLIRKYTSNLVDIFVQPGNYTPQTLVNKINELIININPTYVDPFEYNTTTGKITFTSKYSGLVIGLTELLRFMGFNSIPNPTTANVPVVSDNIITDDISGPSRLYIKSDSIGNVKKHRTAFSTNKKIKNIIAPLELTSNVFKISDVVEIFLSKKQTFSSIDIQIVDEQGNIVNLNNANIQINMYFYSS